MAARAPARRPPKTSPPRALRACSSGRLDPSRGSTEACLTSAATPAPAHRQHLGPILLALAVAVGSSSLQAGANPGDPPAEPRLELPTEGRLPLPAPPRFPSALDPDFDDDLWFDEPSNAQRVRARNLFRLKGGFLFHKSEMGTGSALAIGRQWWTTHRKLNPIGEVSLAGDLGFGRARGSRGAELAAVVGAGSKRVMIRSGAAMLVERTRFSETELATVWAFAPTTSVTLVAGDARIYALAAPRLFIQGDRPSHPTFPVFDEPVFGGGLSVYNVGVRWTGRWTSAGSFHWISLVLGGL